MAVPSTAEVHPNLPAPEVNADSPAAVHTAPEKDDSDLDWITTRHAAMAIPEYTASHVIGLGGHYIEGIKAASNATCIFIKKSVWHTLH